MDQKRTVIPACTSSGHRPESLVIPDRRTFNDVVNSRKEKKTIEPQQKPQPLVASRRVLGAGSSWHLQGKCLVRTGVKDTRTTLTKRKDQIMVAWTISLARCSSVAKLAGYYFVTNGELCGLDSVSSRCRVSYHTWDTRRLPVLADFLGNPFLSRK